MSNLGDVPCGPCHACCRHELIVLLPDEGDIVESYDHVVMFIPGAGETPYLRQKKNGECIYLGRDGCTIHQRRPHICKIFDCRMFYLSKSRAERQALRAGSQTTAAIFNAGRTRLKTLNLS